MDNFNIQLPGMRVARFSLKKGEMAPLHMHENQNGMSYLVSGKCKVTTYNIHKYSEDKYELSNESTSILNANEYCEITPICNAHKIEALEDSTFIDTFAPGLESGLLSDFLKIIETDQSTQKQIAIKIPMEEAGVPERWFSKSALDNRN